MSKDKFDQNTLDWISELDVQWNNGNDKKEPNTVDKQKLIQARYKSFKDLIGFSEGTDRVGGSDNGYNVIVGGSLFHDYSDHPRILVDLPNLGIKSSAAGRYQILERYWDHYSKQLGLKDFSPRNQDRYAMNMFREVGCMEDIEDGRIEEAIKKCASRWASFPGASYGQHEYDMKTMLDKFDEFMQNNLKSVW